MPIEFRCVRCSKLLRVGDDARGKKARCPDCGTIQEVVPPQDATARPFTEPTSALPLDPNGLSPLGNAAGAPQNPFSEAGAGASPFGAGVANPYQAPTTTGIAPRPLSREAALDRVRVPATGVMVVGIVSLAIQVLAIAMIVVAALSNQGPLEDVIFTVLGQSFGMAASALMIAGALKMKNLTNYPLSLTAAIIAMLPCSGCCLLSMPFGIWALIVLVDNQVKASFE